jgi:hypothetical protein
MGSTARYGRCVVAWCLLRHGDGGGAFMAVISRLMTRWPFIVSVLAAHAPRKGPNSSFFRGLAGPTTSVWGASVRRCRACKRARERLLSRVRPHAASRPCHRAPSISPMAIGPAHEKPTWVPLTCPFAYPRRHPSSSGRRLQQVDLIAT